MVPPDAAVTAQEHTISEGTRQQKDDPMMHTTGRPVFRHGMGTTGNLFLSFIGIAATAGLVQAQPRAFVANTNANSVTVVDTGSDTRTTFDVGAAPGQIVISQDGTHAYVANTGANSFSIISVAANLGDSTVTTRPLNASPTSLALSPDGTTLYVMDAAGYLETCDTGSQASCASVFIGASTGHIAVSGNRVFIASELVYEYDTSTGNVSSFNPDSTPDTFDHGNNAVDLAVLPDGRLYVAVITFHYDWRGFSADGGIVIVNPDGDTPVVGKTIPLFSLPRSIALSADGKRAFVGIQSIWADSLYGAGFLPSPWVATIDATSDMVIAWTDLGAENISVAGTHTAAGLAVTPDRSAVFVTVPSIDSVLEISTETSLVTRSFRFDGAGPTSIAIAPDAAAKPKAFLIEAVDDGPSVPVSAGSTALALANVLANDKIGGGPATAANVALSLVSSTSAAIVLDTATGGVWVHPDAAPGSYAVTYKICDAENPDNCGQAVATVTVRARRQLLAKGDDATSYAGATAIANVLANDTVDADPVTLDVVTLSAAVGAGLTLNADGSVSIAAGVAPGSRSLTYEICDVTAADNCSTASVNVTIARRPIHADPDAGSVARTGGLAVANVLANDTLEPGVGATVANVTLKAVSSTDPGITLNTVTGAVSVASTVTAGAHTLQYQICETASPVDNCNEGVVSITVKQTVIVAVGESVRASNKNASTAVRNVLANDSVGGGPATLANVKLSQVSMSPANTRIKLNADGSVSVMDKAGSGAFALVYEICAIDAPSNCARATVTIDLSGKN